MTRRYRYFWLLPLLLLGGCDPSPQSHTVKSSAFSRPLEITLRGLDAERAATAAEDAVTDLQFIAEVSHPWKPGPLGRTNQLLAFEAEFSANPSLLPLIREARRLSKRSHGYFAPGLGGLQRLWGFHGDTDVPLPPEEAAIRALLEAAPTLDDIHIDGIRMRSDNARLRIDFGAFAQGYAIDTARQRLREHHIDAARIDNGNAVAVLGEGWEVPLGDSRLPLHDGETVVTLSTAGEGDRHPYLNPGSGRPSEGLHSVTVLHPSTAEAAAMAQALLAGGEGKLADLLEVLPVEYALAVTVDGRTITTAALAKRLDTVRRH